MEDNDDSMTRGIDPTRWPPPPPLLINGEADEGAIRKWVARWVFGEIDDKDGSRAPAH